MAIAARTLPTELWREILKLATAWESTPDFDDHENPELYILPPFHKDSQITRTKLSLMRVSRSFNTIAAEFMYEVVNVSSSKAVRTLSKPSLAARLGRYTQVLQIHPPRKDEFRSYALHDWDIISSIVASCKRLVELEVVYGDHNSYYALQIPPATARRLADSVPNSVTRIHWAVRFTLKLQYLSDIIYLLLQRNRDVSTLLIAQFDSIGTLSWDEVCPKHPVSLDKLTRLKIDNSGAQKFIHTKLWNKPNLTRLVLTDGCHIQNDIGDTSLPSVMSLEIVDWSLCIFDGGQSRLYRFLPSLRELTYIFDVSKNYFCNIWAAGTTHSKIQTVNVNIVTHSLPATRAVRLDQELGALVTHLRGISPQALPSLNILAIRNLDELHGPADKITTAIRNATSQLTGVELRMETEGL